jgi:hypothetical protein
LPTTSRCAKLEVGRDHLIRALATALVHLTRRLENALSVTVENLKQLRFVAARSVRELEERSIIDKKYNFQRPVISPETDGLSRCIVTSACVREIQHRHPCNVLRWKEF